MAKVSIGLRGWRFDEDEIFTDEGEFKPLEEIPEDPRHRLVRLSILVEKPCSACYLVHGEAEKARCRQSTIVYGEPLDEVVLCDQHEADFLYWFREGGGRDVAGTDDFRDAFHEWFADGGRAPDGYAGLDHVDTDPDALPSPPDPKEVQRRLEAASGFEGEEIDIRSALERDDGDDSDDDEGALDDLDFGQEYPTG